MTIREIAVFIQSRQKQHVQDNYNLASMTAAFISCSFAGKEAPTIEEMFPSLFLDQKALRNNEKALTQFQAWAVKHNEQWSKQHDT